MVLSTVPASPVTSSQPGFVEPPPVPPLVDALVADVLALVSLEVLLAAPLPSELVLLEPVVPPLPSLLLELVVAVPCEVEAPCPRHKQ